MEDLLLIADLGGAICWIGLWRIDWKRISRLGLWKNGYLLLFSVSMTVTMILGNELEQRGGKKKGGEWRTIRRRP
jgi:hypothetical protein